MATRIMTAVGLLLVAVLLWRSVYVVDEGEVALRTRLGHIEDSNGGPGLHLKSPFDEVHIFDRRILSHTYPGEPFLTRDQKAVNVDFYIKWRLIDALRFYQSTGGDQDAAAQQLGDWVRERLKSAVAGQPLSSVSAQARGALTEAAFEELQQAAERLGLDLIDVQLQRVELTEDVASVVYQRMRQGLIAKAAQLRASGASEAEKIRGEAERRRADVLANATRQAQHLRGEADAQAAADLAKAYGRNTDFAAFYRSMQAYKNTLGRDGDILVISPEGEFFKYLHSASGR
ncbi:MAG TPA: protease modulator HflC [Steroidobacteraceae bacterium]|jgi:membrane protease subunit HflC|nr:protease modulator HflC [Steroidobacteraceae bacterium]